MKRINYRKLWENHHNTKIPEGMEIHHIDGDRNNNDIDNLKLVTIEEHLEIHRKQNDHGAVQAILIRMDELNKKEISKAASLAQIEKLKNGDHNFQKMTKERRAEISKNTISKRLKNCKGAFLIEDPVENSRNAGLKAAEKKAGFLDTNSPNHGSKHVKNTKWWVNENNNRKRSSSSPGEGWVEGMIYKDNENKNNKYN